ncbi:unnamed protein product [Clavelina lepadiformis]|uniref:small monomeric GTPase n=1 Tax=Clavelina lepadiformis TaxID=159417 RepID=A0ABP0F255_CLALP
MVLKKLLQSFSTPFNHSRENVFGKRCKNSEVTVPEIVRTPYLVRKNTISYARKRRPSTDNKAQPIQTKPCRMRGRANSVPASKSGQLLLRKNNETEDWFAATRSSSINILVTGAKNVGKSALTVRFITKRFIGEYISGEDMTYDHVISEEKRKQKIVFLDQSNDEDCYKKRMPFDDQNLEWADGIIVVYDVGNPATYMYALKIINFIQNKSSSSEDLEGVKPILLVGNKTDLAKRWSLAQCEMKNVTDKIPSWVTSVELSAADGFEKVPASINELISEICQIKRISCGSLKKEQFRLLMGSVFRPRMHKTSSGMKFGSI